MHPPQAPPATAATQQAQAINLIITPDLLFPKPKKNRRFTAREFQEEIEDAFHWKRPVRTFIRDTPTYPWVPKNPYEFMQNYYNVCFDLNFTE